MMGDEERATGVMWPDFDRSWFFGSNRTVGLEFEGFFTV
jgi:hypothetical protein